MCVCECVCVLAFVKKWRFSISYLMEQVRKMTVTNMSHPVNLLVTNNKMSVKKALYKNCNICSSKRQLLHQFGNTSFLLINNFNLYFPTFKN